MADFTINGVQVDTKLLSGIGGNAAKNVTKGVKQVGDNGIVQVIRSSDSKTHWANLKSSSVDLSLIIHQ